MNKKAFILAALTIIIWGTSFVAIRASLLGGYTPGHLVLARFLIASSLFIVYAVWPGTKFRLPAAGDLLKIALLGFVGITVYHVGVTYGEQTVTAGTAGMFIASAPIFTALIAVVFLKERLTAFGWAGMGIGLLGVLLITLGSEGSSFSISSGALFILTAALAASVFFVFQKPLLGYYSAIELTAYFTWAGTIPLFVFTPGLLDGVRHATLEANLSLIYTGVFAAAIAYVMWAKALSMSDTGAVASLLYVEPLVAIIVAWIWLNEWPSTLSLAGGVIAIVSVVLIAWRGNVQAQKE